jgi:ATP/maltotriose-dependent transcriptional regulator MalT
MVEALHPLATCAEFQGDLHRARTLARRALTLAGRVGGLSRAYALIDLARIVWKEGNLDQAVAVAEEAVVTARALDAARPRLLALINLGNAFRDRGNLARARAVLEQGVRLARELDDERNLAFCLDALGQVAFAQGRRSEAQTRLDESLRMWWEMGQRAKVLDSLETHAHLEAAGGKCQSALQLAGAAAALRGMLRVFARPRDEAVHEAWLQRTRQEVGEDTCAALLLEGQGMTMDQAVACALGRDRSVAPQATTPDVKLQSWAPLTAREQEVARLVADGRSNRQIARELVVTEATAAKHLENIREKLGVRSRTQVAAWVRDREWQPDHL